MLKLFAKKELKIDFLKTRRIVFIFSVVLLIASVASFATKGLNYGIDFEGGVLIEAVSDQPVDMESVRGRLTFLNGLTIQSAGVEGRTVMIQAKPDEAQNSAALINRVRETLGSAFKITQAEVVGPSVGQELKEKSFWAALLALLAISVYIWFRFEWPFAVGCMVSLAHDLVIVIGFFAFFGWDFDMVVIAGLLSLAGYDCNDTIVTYDRIRENLRKYRRLSVDEILNKSINETFSRTILTSLTTLSVILVLLFVGGEALEGFSIAMLLGTVFGTYSSIYIAVPLLRYFNIRLLAEPKAEGPEA